MKIAVYTTLYGDYDTPKPFPVQQLQCDYYCITDKFYNETCIVNPYPRIDLNNRLKAKYFKCMPFEDDILNQYDVWIYLDSSIQVISDLFVTYIMGGLGNSKCCFFKHPWNTTLKDELIESRKHKKYNDESLEYQVSHYLREIGDNKYDLLCGGLHVRRNTPSIRFAMKEWWYENIKWSYQDQISLPYILFKNDIHYNLFSQQFTLSNNLWQYHNHNINDYGQ